MYVAYTTPCRCEMRWKLGGGRFLRTLVWRCNSWDWGWVSTIFPGVLEEKPFIYIYINKDENPSTKSTRHGQANVNSQEENQNNPKSSNEIENLMLKGHPLPHIT